MIINKRLGWIARRVQYCWPSKGRSGKASGPGGPDLDVGGESHEHRAAVVVGADRGASCLRSWPVTASRWWWSGSSRSWAWAGTHICSLSFFFTYNTTSMCHLRDTTKQLNRHEQHVYHSYSFHIIPLESLRVSTHWRSEDYKHEQSLWIFYPNKLSLQYYTSVV
jgi:hypothetical protein